MATIIGSNTVYFTCESEKGCMNESQHHYSYGRNSAEIAKIVREQEGWYISMTNDESYCPKHSPYNNKEV